VCGLEGRAVRGGRRAAALRASIAGALPRGPVGRPVRGGGREAASSAGPPWMIGARAALGASPPAERLL
jgi:hypothetical protein